MTFLGEEDRLRLTTPSGIKMGENGDPKACDDGKSRQQFQCMRKRSAAARTSVSAAEASGFLRPVTFDRPAAFYRRRAAYGARPSIHGKRMASASLRRRARRDVELLVGGAKRRREHFTARKTGHGVR